MLSVKVRRRLDAFELDSAFASDSGVTALFGRSGSGKTTLVNAIAGLVRPDDGRIEVNGDCLFDSARGIDVPYIVKDNEGHGFHNEENQFEFYESMEKFLDKYIGAKAN